MPIPGCNNPKNNANWSPCRPKCKPFAINPVVPLAVPHVVPPTPILPRDQGDTSFLSLIFNVCSHQDLTAQRDKSNKEEEKGVQPPSLETRSTRSRSKSNRTNRRENLSLVSTPQNVDTTLSFVFLLLNHLASSSLGWHTPLECLHGVIPDILAFLQFEVYEPVYHRKGGHKFFTNIKEGFGYFVGIAENVVTEPRGIEVVFFRRCYWDADRLSEMWRRTGRRFGPRLTEPRGIEVVFLRRCYWDADRLPEMWRRTGRRFGPRSPGNLLV